MALLDVRDLTKHLPRSGSGLFGRVVGRAGVDRRVASRSSRARRSASSASRAAARRTTGRCMLRLIEPTSGEVRVQGRGRARASTGARCARRGAHMQMVFQDPYSSLNPRMRVGDDRRRAARDPRDRHEGRARGARRRALRAGRARSGASRSLSARVQRRPAPAHRPGARARAQPVVHHRRRAGVGARRVDPGAGHQPADRPAGAARR